MSRKILLRDEKVKSVSDSSAEELALTADTDVLDWDACIETPPPRPQGTIRVQMTYAGRSRPVPISDPAAD